MPADQYLEGAARYIAEPIPMKRELKRDDSDPRTELDSFIAEPIPMKRELKLFGRLVILLSHFIHCRAYPDEKGIETGRSFCRSPCRYRALQSLSR